MTTQEKGLKAVFDFCFRITPMPHGAPTKPENKKEILEPNLLTLIINNQLLILIINESLSNIEFYFRTKRMFHFYYRV